MKKPPTSPQPASRWEESRQRYRAGLERPEKEALLASLTEEARHGTVTLVFAARAVEHSSASVLKDVLEDRYVGRAAGLGHRGPSTGASSG